MKTFVVEKNKLVKMIYLFPINKNRYLFSLYHSCDDTNSTMLGLDFCFGDAVGKSKRIKDCEFSVHFTILGRTFAFSINSEYFPCENFA